MLTDQPAEDDDLCQVMVWDSTAGNPTCGLERPCPKHEPLAAGTCQQCAQHPMPHHPHHGHPGCDPGDGCDCYQYLWCAVCWQMWPCSTKERHVAERHPVA